MLTFIRVYLDEQGSKEDPEKLLDEVEVFMLAPHMLWSLWGVVNADFSQITFGHWVSSVVWCAFFICRCCRVERGSFFKKTKNTPKLVW